LFFIGIRAATLAKDSRGEVAYLLVNRKPSLILGLDITNDLE